MTLAIMFACITAAAACLIALMIGIRSRVYLGLLALAVFAFAAYMQLRLVCAPIDAQSIASFDPPIEQRKDVGLTGQPYFQRRNGQWNHCKPWIARKLFFLTDGRKESAARLLQISAPELLVIVNISSALVQRCDRRSP